MNIVFLDAGTLGADMDLSAFRAMGSVTVYDRTGPNALAARLCGAEIAVINKVRLTAAVLAEAPTLRLICITATGFDNVDLDCCRERGIAVCNVVGYSTRCVAQVTVTMALSLITHLREYTDHVRSGAYTNGKSPNCLTPVYHEIAGKTWGVVGYGNIGRQVAHVAEALGCRVLVCKRTPVSGVACADMETVCREADILSLHIPLNASTRNLLSRERISLLRPDAVVINVARGAVADEAALAEAVREGRIGGLGVDVYSAEPLPADHPYQSVRHLPNVCLTPHMAWGGYETRVRLLEEIRLNMEAFARGERRCRVD